MKVKSRPRNYWHNWDNFSRELCEVIDNIGHFPSSTELYKSGKAVLWAIMRDHHGGVNTVREKFGYSRIEKPKQYSQLMFETEQQLKENLKDYIEREYEKGSVHTVTEKLNQKLQGFSLKSPTVWTWFKVLGIKARKGYETNSLQTWEEKPSKEQLTQWHLKEGKSAYELSKKFGVSRNAVLNLLHTSGITVRNKRNIYDNKEARKHAMDELLNACNKRPEEITSPDFVKAQKQDGTCYSGVLAWYQRKNLGSTKKSIDFLLEDLYGIPLEERNPKLKRGLYENKQYRKKFVDEFLSKIDKPIYELKPNDFAKIKQVNGHSYIGIITWYADAHECSHIQALEILAQDLFDKNLSLLSKRITIDRYNKKSFRKKVVHQLLEYLGKNPEELSTDDFEKNKQEDGSSFLRILLWYKRKYQCKIGEARDKLVEDIFSINMPEKRKLKKLNQKPQNQVNNFLKDDLENILIKYIKDK
ncbi:MAG: hypothetical protein Q7S27_00255 [Nanoarchaeota archaeon]|nr:hypothetical protein [Nanoarchaeota archaeon]